MPVSSIKGKQEIVNWMGLQHDISSILDIGPGSGTYPKLFNATSSKLREYHWTAVEIWAPYIKQYDLNKKYHRVIIGDVCHVRLPKADCIILGDVLEHMSKKDAKKVIKRVEKFKHAIISIPVDSNSQCEANGNAFERHISVWTRKEMEELFKGYKQHFISNGVGCDIGVFLR